MDPLFDAHCHLGFTPDPAACARQAAIVQVGAFSCTVTPGEYAALQPVLQHAPNVALGLGLHPWWIADGRCDQADLEQFCEQAPQLSFIGEIGLDFARDRATEESRTLQLRFLRTMFEAIGASAAEAKPVISLHSVRATHDLLDLLEQTDTLEHATCILHWFSGTSPELTRALSLGCLFSIGPRMLASKRGRAYAQAIPSERLLLETDGPAHEGEPLPAEPWRGELEGALDQIAQIKHLDRSQLAETLRQTVHDLFISRLPLHSDQGIM